MDFLNDILANKKKEINDRKKVMPYSEIIKKTEENNSTETCKNKYSLKESIKKSSSGIIAEFKRKSPSKGWINENADLHSITESYCKAGASGLSVLTDERFFGGNIKYLKSIRDNIKIPILRKDFIIDEYQIYESAYYKANAILLIANNLSKKECSRLASMAHMHNLEVILEIHNENEIEYLECEPDIIGVNNRNLKTFETNIDVSFKLAELIPETFIKISESGINNVKDMISLKKIGYNGFLIGESLMREANQEHALLKIINEINYNL